MIFEVGKWYLCSAKKRPVDWNPEGLMDGVLDGRPHKCTVSVGDNCSFDVTPREDNGGTWSFWDSDELFDEVPIMSVIEDLPISQETKAYALRSATEIIASGRADRLSGEISGFTLWGGTKEGSSWWSLLNRGEDPGIPKATTPPFTDCKAVELREISTIPVGTRVRLISYNKSDRYRVDYPELISRTGQVKVQGPYTTKIEFDKGVRGNANYAIDHGAMCEILAPSNDIGRRFVPENEQLFSGAKAKRRAEVLDLIKTSLQEV